MLRGHANISNYHGHWFVKDLGWEGSNLYNRGWFGFTLQRCVVQDGVAAGEEEEHAEEEEQCVGEAGESSSGRIVALGTEEGKRKIDAASAKEKEVHRTKRQATRV